MDFSDDHMMGGEVNDSWGFDLVAISSLVNILNMPNTMMMARNLDYVILRQVILKELIEKATNNIKTQQSLQTIDRFIVYQFTSSTCELVDEFMRV